MSSTDLKKDTLIYFRRNGGNIIGDRRAIDNVKREQLRDIIDCGRLGSYNDKGDYVIDKSIKYELINMTKYLYNTSLKDPLRKSHDIYYLYANLPAFDRLDFILDIGEGYASLYLTEKVYKEGGQYFDIYEENILNFPIDNKMTLDYIFNILKVKPTDDGGKRYKQDNVENILIRKLYLKSVADNVREGSVKVEREAFEECIALLKGAGPYGEKVLKSFVEKLSDRQEIIEQKDNPEYNKSLNDILLGVIELVTTEEDLKSSANKSVFRQVTTLRNERIGPVIEEAKSSVTSTEVKGKYFEVSKEDLPIEAVNEVCDELKADTFVDKAPVRETPLAVEGIVSISKDQVVAEKLEAKAKEVKAKQAEPVKKVDVAKQTKTTTKADVREQPQEQQNEVLDEVDKQDDTVVAVGKTTKMDERILDKDTKEELGSKQDKTKKAKVEELLARKEQNNKEPSEDKDKKPSQKQENKETKLDNKTRAEKNVKTPSEDKRIDLSNSPALTEDPAQVKKNVDKAAVIAAAVDRAKARYKHDLEDLSSSTENKKENFTEHLAEGESTPSDTKVGTDPLVEGKSTPSDTKVDKDPLDLFKGEEKGPFEELGKETFANKGEEKGPFEELGKETFAK